MHPHDHHDHGPNKGPGHDRNHIRGHARAGDARRVFWAMWLTGGFMVVEVVGGLLSGSLALLSDAGHMLTDFAALLLAWFAFRLADKRADIRRSYGYHRFQVLAAFSNGLALFAIAGWIVVEAARRLAEPVPVLAGPMLAVAALGLAVNVAAFVLLHGGSRDNLNLRGAALHVMGDLLASVAAIAAALVILATGWTPIDPLLSVLVALLILRAAWKIVRKAGHILLEGTPENVDPGDLRDRLKAAVPQVTDVHHVHIWSLTGGHPVITLHAVLADGADHNQVLANLHRALEAQFGISHATIQLERGHCPDDAGEPAA
jgi:cobalt-zinc-cadmium efflux system protein